MKLAVIGAGIAGIATAHELASDGHEVVVYERHQTVAEEGSFASAALLAPVWTGAPDGQAAEPPSLAACLGLRPGLQLAGVPGAGQWRWLWNRARAARAALRTDLGQHQLRLARYGQERLLALATQHELDHERQAGLLVLWRTEREHAQAQPGLRWLKEQGAVLRELGAAEARLREPALNPDTPLHAALELPGACAINGRQLALQLRDLARQRGVRFEFGCEVLAMAPGAEVRLDIRHPTQGQQAARFDAVVLCAALGSPALLQPLGRRLAMQPVWGYTLSAIVREPLDAPLASVIDARTRISISRLGQRVRVAGGQLLGSRAASRSPAQMRRLYRTLADWFPGAARLAGPQAAVQEWQGATACSPDGLPVLGESGLPGVWLNLGHGPHGWSTACGGARLLADRLRGAAPDIGLSPYTLLRSKA